MTKRNYEIAGTPRRGDVDGEWDDPYVYGDQAGYGRDPEATYDAARNGAEAAEDQAFWAGKEQLGHIRLDTSVGSMKRPELTPEEVKRLRSIGVGLMHFYDEDGMPLDKSKDK